MTPLLDATISVRVSAKARAAFIRKASQYGKPSDLLRELIDAYNERRLTVTQKPRKDLK